MRLCRLTVNSFNPRTYIRYDFHVYSGASPDALFQSTYLYKVRHHFFGEYCQGSSFNPRTYIRYDFFPFHQTLFSEFQSTYLYKVRHIVCEDSMDIGRFQSTYLYKVRPKTLRSLCLPICFNPRTYIRYDFYPYSLLSY